MKKASTWYLLTLAALNFLLALGTSYSAKLWASGYHATLGNDPAHAFEVTQQCLRFCWWPYLFFGVALVFALISIFSRTPSNVFYHFIIIMLLAESFILFMGSFSLSASRDDTDFYVRHRDFGLIQPPPPPWPHDAISRGFDSVFRPEEFHLGRSATISCTVAAAIKRRNPLCLLNPIFLHVSW